MHTDVDELSFLNTYEQFMRGYFKVFETESSYYDTELRGQDTRVGFGGYVYVIDD